MCQDKLPRDNGIERTARTLHLSLCIRSSLDRSGRLLAGSSHARRTRGRDGKNGEEH